VQGRQEATLKLQDVPLNATAGMPRLRDILTSHPRVLFVGINPSLRSQQVGHHFAGPGNPFWRLLYAARIVPEELTYSDDTKLGLYGLALTNLCPRATRAASELGRDEIEQGARTVMRKIARLRPAVVAFVGATIYRHFCANRISGGVGPKPETIHGARVFVLPNPSGLNANFPGFKDKLVWFEKLREFAQIDAEQNSASRLGFLRPPDKTSRNENAKN
jgi:double-stranded uracil-DNA glycosylase